MTQTVDLGSFICLSLSDGSGFYSVPVDRWDELDGAYHHWTERRIDKVMDLVTINGARVLIAISRVGDLSLSTPEARAVQRERDAATKAEEGFTE